MQDITKPCTLCHVTKPLTDFARQTQKQDGRKPYCKTCENEQRKQAKRDKEQYSKQFFTH